MAEDDQASDCQFPLHAAAERGDVAGIREALARGADLASYNDKAWTPLLCAIAAKQGLAVEYLLSCGADPNQCSWQKRGVKFIVTIENPMASHSPIMLATARSSPDVVRALLAYGAYPDVRNTSDQSALQLATSMNRVEIARALLEAGASPSLSARESRRTALHIAAERGRIEIARLLLERGARWDTPLKDDEKRIGQTPVHRAAHALRAEMIELFVEHKVSLEQRDGWARTPLFLVVETQVESGPTEGAERDRFLKCLKVLMDAGADPDARANVVDKAPRATRPVLDHQRFLHGLTPVRLAERLHDDEAVEILRTAPEAKISRLKDRLRKALPFGGG